MVSMTVRSTTPLVKTETAADYVQRHARNPLTRAHAVSVQQAVAVCRAAANRVAGLFPRRETRQSCGQMVRGLLMELEDHNCWTIAEAVGHCGPHQLQRLLSPRSSGAGRLARRRRGWR
jgi:hypothetical protein